MRKDIHEANQIPSDCTTADTAEHKLLKQESHWLMLKISLLVFLSQKMEFSKVLHFHASLHIWFSSNVNTSSILLKCHFCRKVWNRYGKFIQVAKTRFWKYTSCSSILVWKVLLVSLKHSNKTFTLPGRFNQWVFTIIMNCFLWGTHTNYLT